MTFFPLGVVGEHSFENVNREEFLTHLRHVEAFPISTKTPPLKVENSKTFLQVILTLANCVKASMKHETAAFKQHLGDLRTYF